MSWRRKNSFAIPDATNEGSTFHIFQCIESYGLFPLTA